ncbi:PLD nuclease N-terminal domain-containing protein [Cesiribacter andamanensis]|uniref:Cardiolipin synthase N-terminal domain-containing protein n=1 Tax=Cesiribacter andamanensis AMV16 TaxID=1279009 RepID=M7NUI1_9BACT|nr:PLD nuclease N-terminal domain-containing protein [Cesiribacter andamanensis]EMR02139.1 hypothetical protein ADICEAN_02701 [Cesiribacter andamanensis AMV16]
MQTLLFFNIGGAEIILLLFILLSAALWLWALVEVIRSDFRRDVDKIVWILILVFGSLLGAPAYFALGRRQRIQGS